MVIFEKTKTRERIEKTTSALCFDCEDWLRGDPKNLRHPVDSWTAHLFCSDTRALTPPEAACDQGLLIAEFSFKKRTTDASSHSPKKDKSDELLLTFTT